MVEHSVPPESPNVAADSKGSDADPQRLLSMVAVAEAGGVVDATTPSGIATASTDPSLSGLARGDVQTGVRTAKKQESIVSEFNALLASQMTAQRRYYDERQKE